MLISSVLERQQSKPAPASSPEVQVTTFVFIVGAPQPVHGFTLPGEPEIVSARSFETLKSGVIAVIDNDEDVRAALDGLLESLGYRSKLFESGDSFLAANGLDDVDGIISDIQMPGTSGLQLAEEIQRHAKPVILITAFPTPEVHQRASAAGVLCVLIKPFDFGELIDQLSAQFG